MCDVEIITSVNRNSGKEVHIAEAAKWLPGTTRLDEGARWFS